MRRVGLAVWLLVACLALPAGADYSPTYTAYPGWQITSSDDMWAIERGAVGKRYPLTNLTDGNPRTAWVFEGLKWNGQERPDGYRPLTGRVFGHGEGQWIQITSLAKDPPVIDAVGIINGYAKDAATYRRNNRITQVRIEPGGWYPPETGGDASWQPKWRKIATLREGRGMQIVPIPRTRLGQLTLYVERAAGGPDNDLCISEIQLFSRGRPVLSRPTRYVLYCAGSECGDGDTLYLVNHAGGRAPHLGDLAEEFFAFGFPKGGRLAVVGGYGEKRARVQALDLRRGVRVYDLPLPEDTYGWEWVAGTTMRYQVGAKPTRTYEVSFSGPKPARRLVRK